MKSWQELKAEIDREVELTTLEPVRDVVDVFRYSISKGGAGVPNDNQIFTTWFFGGADVNYIADWCYFIIELSKKENNTMEKLCQMTRFWVLQPSEFGHYCGLRKQYEFTQTLNEIMDNLQKEELVAILDSFRSYLANINAWVFQYMPWGVGYAFPRKDKAYYEAGLELAQGI
ncbi:MAG: hypothetical protein EOM66_01655 [Clostridia bacterium]|nr:hypothetical protein [Clostridia bacterium]